MRTPDCDALIAAAGPGHWLWKNFYSAPSQTQITSALQAGVIMQLYAKLGTMSTHSSPEKSEIHCDVALDIWFMLEIWAKVHQFLAKIKLFFRTE